MGLAVQVDKFNLLFYSWVTALQGIRNSCTGIFALLREQLSTSMLVLLSPLLHVDFERDMKRSAQEMVVNIKFMK